MHKLTLHRETLHHLQARDLGAVAGGTMTVASFAPGVVCGGGETLSCEEICPWTKFNTCRDCVTVE